MSFLHLQGSPYEVGFQHGKKLRELVTAFCSFCHNSLSDIPKPKIDKIVSKVEGGLKNRYPEALEEMRGISDGSKLNYNDVLLMNFTSEVISQASSGCTAFVAAKTATREKNPIMGKTRDMASQIYFPFQTTMEISEPGNHRIFLAEAFSGMAVTGCGINECGLCVALSIIRSVNDIDDTIGVQRAFLARLILEECENVDEAIHEFSETDLAFQGANFTICDSSGEFAVIEKSHNHQATIRNKKCFIASTNHFTAEKMRKICKTYGKSSQGRLERISTLLELKAGTIDVSIAKNFLKDHAMGFDTNSICRHSSYAANTVQAYVIDPKSRKIYIANGHPCQQNFRKYQPFK